MANLCKRVCDLGGSLGIPDPTWGRALPGGTSMELPPSAGSLLLPVSLSATPASRSQVCEHSPLPSLCHLCAIFLWPLLTSPASLLPQPHPSNNPERCGVATWCDASGSAPFPGSLFPASLLGQLPAVLKLRGSVLPFSESMDIPSLHHALWPWRISPTCSLVPQQAVTSDVQLLPLDGWHSIFEGQTNE